MPTMRILNKTQLWLFVLRVALGAVFIIAGISKLSTQAQLINEVVSYEILTYEISRIFASVLPWAELVTGVCLILGVFLIPAVLLSILISLSFIIGNSYHLSQGASGSCACFGQLIPLSRQASLATNFFMLAAGIALFMNRNKASLYTIEAGLNRLTSKLHGITGRLVTKGGLVVLLAAIILPTGMTLASNDTASTVYTDIDTYLGQKKPAFLFFYMDMCTSCAQQKPVVEEIEKQWSEKIGFVHVDYMADAAVAADFKIKGVPAILIISGKDDGGYIINSSFPALAALNEIEGGIYQAMGIPDPTCIQNKQMANFHSDTTSVNGVIPVQFINQSSDDAVSWNWDFDNDGTVDSTQTNPVYTYQKNGTYSVSLTVKGTDYQVTLIRHNYITVTGVPTPTPTR